MGEIQEILSEARKLHPIELASLTIMLVPVLPFMFLLWVAGRCVKALLGSPETDRYQGR